MRDKLGNKGQSSVEFIFAFIFAFGFFLFFIRLSIMYTNGYLVHYATYMASRTYMVYDGNENDKTDGDRRAQKDAREVFNSFSIDKFIPGFNNNLSFKDPSAGGVDQDRNILVGLFVTYEVKIPYPLITAGNTTIHLRSDSFLGREPNRAECLSRTCDRLKTLGADGDCGILTTVVDNGC